jgi:hypothetical protein
VIIAVLPVERPRNAKRILGGFHGCFAPWIFRTHMDRARLEPAPAEWLRRQGLMFDPGAPKEVAELFLRAPESRVAEFPQTTCISN